MPAKKLAGLLPSKCATESRHSTYTENASIAAWDRRVERDDRLRLKTEQTHVTNVAITVAHPHVPEAACVETIYGGRTGKLQKDHKHG